MKRIALAIAAGIRTSDTRSGIGLIDGEIHRAGMACFRWGGGYVSPFLTRFGNETRARQFLTFCRDLARDYTVIPLGFSNGCRVINDASWLADDDGTVPPYDHCLYISPALDVDTPLAHGIEKCDVYFTKNDWAVVFSSLLLFHPMGQMGRLGPSSNDPRYRKRVDGTKVITGHTDWRTGHGIAFLRSECILPLGLEYNVKPLLQISEERA